MASTYTAAGIELIAQGEQAGAWGNTTNTNWQLVEEMVGGVVDITLTGASYSLSTSDGASSEGRHSVLNFSGSPGATCTVTVTPNDMQKVYFVVNGSDQTVTISQGTGANVSVSAGKNKIVFCDGAGVGAAVTDISSGFDATTLTELGVTASASELNTLDGITATTAELNTLDGITASTAELNKLDGVTSTTTELNYVDGVTSSIQTQLDAMVEKAGDTMTGALTLSGDPTSANHAATKSYVDTIAAAGIHYHDPVRVESPSNLNATYDNGTSGVGATLTNAGTNAAISIDGVALSSADRVLVYNQTNAAHNGVYTVTTVGDGSTAWVLTRATDADSYGVSAPDALGEGDAFFVKEGDTGAGELYVMNTSGTITFGTTGITFSVIAETAVYTAGSGLDLTGTTFSHTDTSSQASVNNSGNTFIQDVTLDGFGHITALTSATAVINDGTLTLATSGTGLSGSGTFTANDSDNVTFTVTSNATNANTASTIVARDASGNFSAGTITASLSGNSSTATKLATSRTLSISGDATGSASFDGSANAAISISLAADSVAASEIAANAVGASELNVSGNGTTSQFLRSDGDGTFTWATPTDTNTTYSAGSGLSLSGTTFSHTDTSSQASVNNSGNTFIQDVTLDTYGHVTGLTSASLSLGALASLDTVNAATITDNSVGAAELNVSGNGTTAQFLRSDGDGTFTWATPTDTNTTYSAGAGLDLSGTTFSVESDLRGDVFYIGRDTNDYYVVNTTVHDWYLDGVLDMRLTNAGTLHCDGDIIAYSTTTSSDEKLKDDIEVVADALNKVNELRGVTFNWKKDGSASAGVIAQDVLKVLPCAVTEVDELNSDDSHLTVNYSALTSLLVESIKELTKRVEELEAK